LTITANKRRDGRGNPGARVGHKFKDRVRDAYYLADPDDLRKTYMRYIDYLNVKSSPVNYSSDEIRELQQLVAGMKKELQELKGEV
jgi:predicted ATPase